MKKFLRCERGTTAIEFGFVALPVLLFMVGIMQIAFIVWADNLLHLAVNTAARCGAVNSTTTPCAGTDMITAANSVFLPLSGASFTANTCSAGSGLIGTYDITFLFADVTLTAQSCYPNIS
jgi:Flp pilus assembly protein TadG